MFQGIYVLQDNKFRLLSQLSAGKQYLEHAPKVRPTAEHAGIRAGVGGLDVTLSAGQWLSVQLGYFLLVTTAELQLHAFCHLRLPNLNIVVLNICRQIKVYLL